MELSPSPAPAPAGRWADLPGDIAVSIASRLQVGLSLDPPPGPRDPKGFSRSLTRLA